MRALLSVYDKSGLVEFAEGLSALGYELVSTGGSAKTLEAAGLPVTTVESVTGFPEILDGRVKTLHPHIHAGLLARRDLPEHMSTLRKLGITEIDVLVSNLYPFRQTLLDGRSSEDDRIEQIDIGGPAMVRAAAKNFTSVVVVTSPSDYSTVMEALQGPGVDLGERRKLAARAFRHVSTYDSLVADFLGGETDLLPQEFALGFNKVQDLRYGENPQQTAAVYSTAFASGPVSGVLDAVQLHGKELSYNNILDADAAWRASKVSTDPTVAVVKHMLACGLATRDSIADAYSAAFEGDTVSAYGGIVALNRRVDLETAARMSSVFYEIVIAPGFDEEALQALKRKKNLRILELPDAPDSSMADPIDLRQISGGMLVQSPDVHEDDPASWNVVSARQPTDQEWQDLELAWKAARLAKSNAIVFARDRAVVGVGAGQPNRLESVLIASRKAGEKAQGAALASDAFFPFADGIELGLSSGVTAVVQPGGSMRDQEVIDSVDRAGAAMVFTGTRHFRH